MSDKDGKVRAGRRDFMKLAGLSAVTGGTFAALGQEPAEAAAAPQEAGSYRESEHIRTYYRTARF
ncbi:twin-arginine translocation signal domain-containing protein [Kaustia mangrovi]|uniref:Twin-arginine translocation signal domain-containing protein n=1 Tax=Kaustia mangrovi TaxID=2593653 RepID=A0A7S8HDR9_9HYPH|nr:twin-arginine translocation signal domain-containing protein [Kaustia mangrovi]QPC44774.1 twin-arginine translocation signal domain-containing protein [Kaustia mangrovi]